MKVSAIILAGGLATRMGEICCKTPKSMLNFAGFPFLQYLVSWFIEMGLSEILISTGCLSEQIEKTFNNEFWIANGVKIVKEDKPLGTGGATRFSCENCENEDIFLCNGDTVVSMDFFRLYGFYKIIGKPITTILTLSKGVPNQGAVLVENGKVSEFCEEGEIRESFERNGIFRGSSTGCYFLKRSLAYSLFPVGASSLEKEVLPNLVSMGKVGAVNNGLNFFLDYGIPERFEILKNNSWILKKIYGEPITRGNTNEQD